MVLVGTKQLTIVKAIRCLRSHQGNLITCENIQERVVYHLDPHLLLDVDVSNEGPV